MSLNVSFLFCSATLTASFIPKRCKTIYMCPCQFVDRDTHSTYNSSTWLNGLAVLMTQSSWCQDVLLMVFIIGCTIFHYAPPIMGRMLVDVWSMSQISGCRNEMPPSILINVLELSSLRSRGKVASHWHQTIWVVGSEELGSCLVLGASECDSIS